MCVDYCILLSAIWFLIYISFRIDVTLDAVNNVSSLILLNIKIGIIFFILYDYILTTCIDIIHSTWMTELCSVSYSDVVQATQVLVIILPKLAFSSFLKTSRHICGLDMKFTEIDFIIATLGILDTMKNL